MTRRANNEGSIYRDKKGNWRGSVTLYTANGKPKKKYFYGRTKKEVADKVNRTLNEIRNHTYIEPNSMTLAEWLRIWLDTAGIRCAHPLSSIMRYTWISISFRQSAASVFVI